MPNFTARLGLRKPLTTEFYDVTESNSSMQAIDDAAVLMDIDNASVGAVGSDALLKLSVTGAGPAGNRMIEGRKVGDANVGFAIDFDGSMQFGPGGASGPDVNLKRSAANVLYTDDGFQANHASMATVEANLAATGTVSSITFSDAHTAGVLSANITTPPSGKIKITVVAQNNPTAGNAPVAYTSARISGLAGATGTRASTDAHSILSSITATDRKSVSWIESGLAPMTALVVTMQHRGSSASSCTYVFRTIIVEPCLA